jgi:hypothetical protein
VTTVIKEKLLTGKMQPIYEALKLFIETNMLAEPPTAEELILVGDLDNDKGETVTHATTFVRLMRYDEKKKKDVPVLVFLDCNFPDPCSTNPSLLKERPTALLNWRSRFMFYKKIVVFRLQEKYSYNADKHARKLQFAKDVIS